MGNMELKAKLKRHCLFVDLPEEILADLETNAQIKTFRKGDHIFFHGEEQLAVYFIIGGIVKIYRTDAKGREQILSVLNEGELFPHTGFFQKISYPGNAVAVQEAELAYFLLEDFETLILKHGELCIRLFRTLEKKIMELQNRLEDQLSNNAYEQVAKLLLRLTEQYGESLGGEKVRLRIPLSHKEMAQIIGTTRETVSRTFSGLKRKNIVFHDDTGAFYIVNREKLAKELDPVREGETES
ncbi:MAG: hypothetical protein BAA03_11655 [Caldibacillus debilis]|nr:MAG: hypothetical protein BAA03_11655 [Caldibacillus debilis]